MKNRRTYALLSALVLALAACGGGSSGTDSGNSGDKSESDTSQGDSSQSESSQSNNSQSNKYGFGGTSSELKAITDNIEIELNPKLGLGPEVFLRDKGITFEFTKFVVDEVENSFIHVRVNNGSSQTIGRVHCAIDVWKDGEKINTGNINYTPMTLNPGESAMEIADFTRYVREGFKGMDKLSLSSCNLTMSEREKVDVANGPVKVDFVEFGDRRAAITMSLTNNNPHQVSYAKCIYHVKIGNVIVDSTTLSFRGAINKRGSIIEPGETIVDSATFNDSESVNDFDATFDYDNLNCEYNESKK